MKETEILKIGELVKEKLSLFSFIKTSLKNIAFVLIISVILFFYFDAKLITFWLLIVEVLKLGLLFILRLKKVEEFANIDTSNEPSFYKKALVTLESYSLISDVTVFTANCLTAILLFALFPTEITSMIKSVIGTSLENYVVSYLLLWMGVLVILFDLMKFLKYSLITKLDDTKNLETIRLQHLELHGKIEDAKLIPFAIFIVGFLVLINVDLWIILVFAGGFLLIITVSLIQLIKLRKS